MAKLFLTLILTLAAFNPVASTLNKSESLLLVSYDLYFPTAEFSTVNLHDYLIICGVSSVEIVGKQCLYETGRYTSNLFEKHKNLFGMCYPKYRETTAIDSVLIKGQYYAVFSHWTKSAKDYAIWQAIQSAKFSTENYYEFLEQTGYATDTKYNLILKGIK